MKHIKPAPQPKKDPEMESLYGFEARSKEAKEYFSKLEFPNKWCLKHFSLADLVVIGLSILAFGGVVWLIISFK